MEARRGVTKPVRVLVIDMDPASPRLVRDYLDKVTSYPIICDHSDTMDDAKALGQLVHYDIALVDPLQIGDLDRLTSMTRHLGCPVILLGTLASPQDEIAALRAGASGLVRKPFRRSDLFDAINKAIHYVMDEETSERHLSHHGLSPDAPVLIGQSRAIQSLQRSVQRLSKSDAPIVLTGDVGTGKSTLARHIHHTSMQSDGPFLRIIAGKRGREQGGEQTLAQAWQATRGGTLYIHRFTQLSYHDQAFLLGRLDGDAIENRGEDQCEPRLIVGDSHSPMTALRTGHLSADLYYRLRVIPLHLPPLRDRREDIVPLAEHCLFLEAKAEQKQFVRLDGPAASMLDHHLWLGNIRDLHHTIRQAVLLHDSTVMTVAMLGDFETPAPSRPLSLTHLAAEETNTSSTPIQPFWMQERQIIEEAIAAYDGNISAAAAALEISPSTIYRKRQIWSDKVA